MAASPITREDLRESRRRIGPHASVTPVMTSRALDERTGKQVFLKCENFQRAGAFKIRGATNFVSRLSAEELRRGLVTHSSGNHAQAVALAARLFGTSTVVVMPNDAPEVKSEATRGYGAEVVHCEPTAKAREETCERLMRESRRVLVHPYDHDFTIMGQSTVALELMDQVENLDAILAPVSGGGLISGIALAASFETNGRTKVIACEPELADDAYQSFRAGALAPRPSGPTIADGLRAQICERTFAIIREHVHEVRLVSEREIVETMQFLWERAKLVVEPSGAAALAPVLFPREALPGRRIGVVLSGGNVSFPFPPSR